MELLDYYRNNLTFFRGLSAEFAAEFPKIARRLLISEYDCQDPYIERLLEGTAFLAAKVEKKLDEGYYPFMESLLGSIAPDALYPVPAGAILEVFPNPGDENIKKGAVLQAGSGFETVIPGVNTPCRFSAARDTPLVPFTVSAAEYLSRDMASLGLKDARLQNAVAALRLRFSAAPGEAANLNGGFRVFLALSDADASLLLRLLAHDVIAVYLKTGDDYRPLEGLGFAIPVVTGEQLFGQKAQSNRGLRILQNYLNYPDFFKFFSIHGAAIAGEEIVIVFKRQEQALAGIKASSFKVNCVPVLNLFSRRSDRVSVEAAGGGAYTGIQPYEFHLAPDRTALRDYEVAAVKNVDFYNQRNECIARASAFYDDDMARDRKKQVFFSVKRRRNLVVRRSAARSSYDGTEVFVSFSPVVEDAWQFAADLLVTNRDLPLLLQGGAGFSSSSTLARRAELLTLPTRPGYPLAERGGREDFSRLSHIVMNFSALLCQEGDKPLELLRDMLRSYPIRPPEEMERMAGGITVLSGRSDIFRFIRGGAVFYEWGWRLALCLDENVFAGMGFYVFARVIAEILMSFTPINTILEIEFSTRQSGVIAVWKTSENQ
jgi:type VI secretion system VasI/ImpG family protein